LTDTTQARAFPLGDILSVTTGRLLSRDGIDGVYQILNYLTGAPVFTHQIPRAVDHCQLPLLRQHPELLDVVPQTNAEIEQIEAWLTEQEQRFGETLEVSPIDGWVHRDPIAEAVEMFGADRVIPVVTE
jgi:hypothetical protein